MNRWLENQPIRKKLIYSSRIAIALALLPVVSIMVTYECLAIHNATLHEMRVKADIIRDSSAAAVAFADAEAAKETLAALQEAHDILEAYLILPDGTVLADYRQPNPSIVFGPKFSSDAAESTEKTTINTVTIRKPVILRSEKVGTLILIGSLEGFYNRLMWYIFFTLIATAIAFIMAKRAAAKISESITGPIAHLIAATERITTKRDYSTPLSTETQDEVGSLSRAFKEMMSQIHKRDLSLQQLAYYDRVSGIPNRHYFEERIAQSVDNAARYGTICYLLMIDLDDFKIVNDRLGHHVGDLLLRHVSESLTITMRQSDSIFRIGGDEFAVIIESISDHESLGRIAQKIIQAVSAPVMLEGHEVKIGASIGISCFPKFSTDMRTLMSTADAAMYVAKRGGKNNYQIYESSFQISENQ